MAPILPQLVHAVPTKHGQRCGNTKSKTISDNSGIDFSAVSPATGKSPTEWIENTTLLRTRASASGNVSDTTPTAAQFIAGMAQMGLTDDWDFYELDLINTNTTGSNVTIVAGSNVTLVGNVIIDAGEACRLRIQRTSSTTVTILLLHKGLDTTLSGNLSVQGNATLGNAATDTIITTSASVTQASSITTGVIANGSSGIITTVAATAGAAGATPNTFTVTNSVVTATSKVFVSIIDYAGTIATNGNPFVIVDAIGAGSFNIIISNAHGANALNGALQIAYLVLSN
jgi:hypothetical protein